MQVPTKEGFYWAKPYADSDLVVVRIIERQRVRRGRPCGVLLAEFPWCNNDVPLSAIFLWVEEVKPPVLVGV